MQKKKKKKFASDSSLADTWDNVYRMRDLRERKKKKTSHQSDRVLLP